ncbi:MAG TPA: 3-oxoacyl-ACP synthase III family protein [Clostridia bacterium]|nr:3-oxoacyl-ACP synthase III family protein [Clostridia bacterium]
MNRYKVKLAGTGSYLPGKPVKFEDIQTILGEVTEAPKNVMKWIKSIQPVMKEMLGIEQSHYAIDPETREFTDDNISMSVKAAQKALENAGMKPNDIDFLAYGCACLTQMPTTSVRIQEALGIQACGEMSIHSNCTSAYKAIMLAHDLISVGRYKTVMVISSNMASATMRSEYYNQKLVERDQMLLRWFLCDGAGCLIFTRDENSELKGNYLEATYVESIGCGVTPMMYNKWKSYEMNPLEAYENGLHHIVQEGVSMSTPEGEERGKLIYNSFAEGLKRMASMFDVDLTKTTYFQINLPARHIYDLIKEKCVSYGIPESSFYMKLSDNGYPGPPAALITMDMLFREENLKPGDQIISFVTEVSKMMQGGFVMKHY